MHKKYKIFLLISCLSIISIVFIYSIYNKSTVSIHNYTNQSIKYLDIAFKTNSTIYDNITLKPKESLKFYIDTSNISEDAILLKYKDKDNNVIQTEYLVPYLERGYNIKSNVHIFNFTKHNLLDLIIDK